MSNKLPTFLGLGTQKGGTTTLHWLLNQHPEVYLPKHKELHYFDQNFEKPKEWYSEKFKEAKDNQKIGEITPFYLFHPETPIRIKSVIPKAKLIVLLRDPVERTLSQYFHAKKRGFEHLDIEEALTRETERLKGGDTYSLQKHSYLSRSLYITQIDRYNRLFEEEQILVAKSEDLFENTQTVWARVQEFLEISKINLPANIPNANAGKGESKNVDKRVKDKLRSRLRWTGKEIQKRYQFGWEWCQ